MLGPTLIIIFPLGNNIEKDNSVTTTPLDVGNVECFEQSRIVVYFSWRVSLIRLEGVLSLLV